MNRPKKKKEKRKKGGNPNAARRLPTAISPFYEDQPLDTE